MDEIFNLAEQMQQRARTVIEETNTIAIWTAIGAKINLVGSLQTGLLINNRDIDFHIYTQPFILADSFKAISRLAENKRIKKIDYINLLEAEDQCIEWHAFYEDTLGDSWHIDMIHILPESRWAGYFEKVAERISAVLTPETKAAILRIKNAIPVAEKVMGIQVYQAVLGKGIRDIDAFWQWKKEQEQTEAIITWMP